MRHLRWLFVLALLGIAVAAPCLAQQYNYTDDFSSDKAASDSYEHSDFHASTPDPWPLSGFFVYELRESDRMLMFYSGTLNDAYAIIRYEFPLGGATPGLVFASGLVEFDVVDNYGGMGWVRVGWVFDTGGGWEWALPVSEPGHYTFDLAAGDPPETVLVELKGLLVGIDNLVVRLDYWTPVELSSWARIKQLF